MSRGKTLRSSNGRFAGSTRGFGAKVKSAGIAHRARSAEAKRVSLRMHKGITYRTVGRHSLDLHGTDQGKLRLGGPIVSSRTTAARRGKMLGYTDVRHTKQGHKLENVYVVQGSRGKGIAGQMMKAHSRHIGGAPMAVSGFRSDMGQHFTRNMKQSPRAINAKKLSSITKNMDQAQRMQSDIFRMDYKKAKKRSR